MRYYEAQHYVYVFGLEWAEELLIALERDPEAAAALAAHGLTLADVERYYLHPAHFQRVYTALIDDETDPLTSPVTVLIGLIAAERARSLVYRRGAAR